MDFYKNIIYIYISFHVLRILQCLYFCFSYGLCSNKPQNKLSLLINSSGFLFRSTLKRVEAWMNVWFAFFCLLLFDQYSSPPCGKITKTHGRRLKSQHCLLLFTLFFALKSGRSLQIHSLHLSRATDWSRQLATTATQSPSLPALCWESYALGLQRNKTLSLPQQNVLKLRRQVRKTKSSERKLKHELEASGIQFGVLPFAVCPWAS